MCSQNLKHRTSSSNSNDDHDLRRRKYVKFDNDLTYRKTQPRSVTRYRKDEYHGSRKISRNPYCYANDEEDRSSKQVRFSDSKNEQEKDHAQFYGGDKNQRQNLSCESGDTKSSVKGKGNWDLACALAYLHLFGNFLATDCSSSSPSSSSSSLSSKSSVNSLIINQKHEDDHNVNFVLYVLTGTTTQAECLRKAGSTQHLVVPDVVNPTQAAHHWLSAARRITGSIEANLNSFTEP